MPKTVNLLTPKQFAGALTSDPGWQTGWAHWEGDLLPSTGVLSLDRAATGGACEGRLCAMWRSFDALLERAKPNRVYIEGVRTWEESLKSMTAAKRGDLARLSYLVGGYARACARREIPFMIVDPDRWKGQINKIALRCRIRRATGASYVEHAQDAVGMGLSAMGLL